MNNNQVVTIGDIREALYDAYLDTEYREAMAHALMNLGYVSDSPLNLSFGGKVNIKLIKKLKIKLMKKFNIDLVKYQI